jgi:hypothetical protein
MLLGGGRMDGRQNFSMDEIKFMIFSKIVKSKDIEGLIALKNELMDFTEKQVKTQIEIYLEEVDDGSRAKPH